jgi:adenylosuccinate synthase
MNEFPADIAALDGVEPEYEWFEGWKSSTGAARKLEDLPSTARKYLDRVQALSGAPIRYVSVGTRRDQIIGN